MKMVFFVAVKIWARTLLINAILMVFTVPAGIIIGGFFGTLGAAVAGFILTLPMLLLITPLVKISIKLPYTATARIFWLWFYLEALIGLFYFLFFELVSLLVNGKQGAFYLMAFATSVSLLLAMIWTKKSLRTIIIDKQ